MLVNIYNYETKAINISKVNQKTGNKRNFQEQQIKVLQL